MEFEKHLKNLNVFKNFLNAYRSGKLCQAYLFLSPDGVTNKLLLKTFAKLLLCDSMSGCGSCDHCIKADCETHPDILEYPKVKNFVVDDAKSIYENIQIKPMLADKKVFILNNFDNATEQAQNKMLKILEEPPQNVIFLISATNQNAVLQTILSRVQKMTVDAMSKQSLKDIFEKAETEVLQIAIAFGGGYIGTTAEILQSQQFIDNYKNMANLLKNLKNSSQIPYFSPYFSKDRQIFENCLIILNDLFRELLMYNLNKQTLLNLNEENSIFEIANEFSINSLINILKSLSKVKQKINSNVNLTLLADNMLFDILEIKYLCK